MPFPLLLVPAVLLLFTKKPADAVAATLTDDSLSDDKKCPADPTPPVVSSFAVGEKNPGIPATRLATIDSTETLAAQKTVSTVPVIDPLDLGTHDPDNPFSDSTTLAPPAAIVPDLPVEKKI